MCGPQQNVKEMENGTRLKCVAHNRMEQMKMGKLENNKICKKEMYFLSIGIAFLCHFKHMAKRNVFYFHFLETYFANNSSTLNYLASGTFT